jgi:hypothetical protein
MKKPNYFYIFVIIILFVVLVYLFTNKEGIIFTRQVNVSTILYNSSLDNITKMNMIEQTDVAEPAYTNIIDKQLFCTGVSPYPNTTSNNGQDCADARVNALKKLYEAPNSDYDANLSVYSITHDNTLDKPTKIGLLEQITVNDSSSDSLINSFKSSMRVFDECGANARKKDANDPIPSSCYTTAINSIKDAYNPPS